MFSFYQVVEDGYEFFSKRQLVTLFSAPNYCGEFDNAGAMMSVDDSLMCSFQILKVREASILLFDEIVSGPENSQGSHQNSAKIFYATYHTRSLGIKTKTEMEFEKRSLRVFQNWPS